jgi:hypothetical protein
VKRRRKCKNADGKRKVVEVWENVGVARKHVKGIMPGMCIYRKELPRLTVREPDRKC